MGGIMSIAVGIFGVFWTILAAGLGGGFMAVFGLVFIFIAVANAVYNFKNATGENRYSEFDITDENEEPDPLNERFGKKSEISQPNEDKNECSFCPYCGNKVQKDFNFCDSCGKKLPE